MAEPLIQRSWLRSREFNLNHERIENNDILPTHLFQERSGQAEALLHAAQPVLPLLFNFLQGRHHVVLLSDQDGYILESLGDPFFLTKSQSVHLSPGASWREAVKGTNAIGTALVEKAPVRVLGTEHFVRENHFLGCWAAPILNSNGNTIGILDISSLASRTKERLLDIAVLGARMIEYNLRLREFERSFHLYAEGLRLSAELAVRHELALDSRGVITQITPAAAALLKINPDAARGTFIGDIFQPHFSSLDTTKAVAFLDLSGSSSPESGLTPLSPAPTALASGSSYASPSSSPSPSPLSRYPEPLTTPLWVGSSEVSRKVLQRAAKVAATQTSILLQGESGTGKEIIARHIHLLSPRREGPFIALNCSALPDSLVESELFGYDDGAFTGAKRGGKPGKFELAQGGTIFLDEIGDISPNVQVALLRVLQEKEIYRISSGKAHPLDVRIIAATHRDLTMLVQEGKFRLDLYYRLKVITIELPPLRERIEDVLDLVPHLIAKFSHGGKTYQVAPEIYTAFLTHTWPRNVRELENCIESMCALADGTLLTVADLPPELLQASHTAAFTGSVFPRSSDADTASEEPIPIPDTQGHNGLLRLQARELILDALNHTGGKIAPAARLLGIGRNTLYRKLKELGIEGR